MKRRMDPRARGQAVIKTFKGGEEEAREEARFQRRNKALGLQVRRLHARLRVDDCARRAV